MLICESTKQEALKILELVYRKVSLYLLKEELEALGKFGSERWTEINEQEKLYERQTPAILRKGKTYIQHSLFELMSNLLFVSIKS